MKIKLLCNLPFFLVSAFTYAVIMDMPVDDSLSNSSAGELFFSESEVSYDQLSLDEKYTLMLVSIQNGQFNAAIDIANELRATKPDDVTIKLLGVAESIKEGKLDGIEPKLKMVQVSDKYEAATKNLVTAQYYYINGESQLAIDYLNKVFDSLPKHPYGRVLSGVVYTRLGDVKQARAAFNRALKEFPRFGMARVNLGFLEYHQGNLDVALKNFDAAISIHPINCRARLGKAYSLLKQNRAAEAWSAYSRCPSQENTAESKRLAAYIKMQSQDLAEAWDFVSSIDGFEKDPDSAVLAAEISLKRGDIASAIQLSKGERARDKYIRGLALLAEGKNSKAIELFNEVYSANEKSLTARLASLVALLVSGETVPPEQLLPIMTSELKPLAAFVASVALINQDENKALTIFDSTDGVTRGLRPSKMARAKKLAVLKSGNTPLVIKGLLFELYGAEALATGVYDEASTGRDFFANYLLASTLIKQGKFTESLSAAQLAISNYPEFFEANYLAGEASLKLGKQQSAAEYYADAVKTRPEPGALLKLGVLAERQQNLTQAESYYRQLTEVAPGNPIALNQLAWFYASHNIKIEMGIELVLQAIEVVKDPNYMDTAGWLYFKKKDNKNALRWLKEAKLESGANNASILYHLASVQVADGDKQAALENLTIAKNLGNTKYQEKIASLIESL